jgi:RHS repeat-associated protein
MFTPITYHYNAVGSTIAMTDAGQNIVNKYAYTPFGIIANEVENVQQPFKFVGQYGVMTEPNGLYYMRARYYDPEVGRFVSEDPLGFDGGDVNLYVYVGNNPILLFDPWGLREAMSSYSGTIRIPTHSIEALKSNAEKFQASVGAVGVVTWEVGKMVAEDTAKAVIGSIIPLPTSVEFIADKAITGSEVYLNVTGNFQETAERTGQRIQNLYKWWYGE